MGTFIDSTRETLVLFEVIPSGRKALIVPFQQLLEGPIEVLIEVSTSTTFVIASFISSIVS